MSEKYMKGEKDMKNQKKKIWEERGITLIALVITKICI